MKGSRTPTRCRKLTHSIYKISGVRTCPAGQVFRAVARDMGGVGMPDVLVIDQDDNPGVIGRVCDAEGFSLLRARDAAGALSLAEQHAPAAIITPRALPDRDGLVLIAELRHAAPAALIIVIGDPQDLTVLDAGADAVFADAHDEVLIASALRLATPPAAVAKRLVLTIVEPDLHLAAVMVRWLDAVYDVHVVSTGWRAIEDIRARGSDLVLAEMRLPDMDGPELHAAIESARPGLGDCTLFMTTGYVADKSQQFLARIPGQWIHKPFDLARLHATLSALVYS